MHRHICVTIFILSIFILLATPSLAMPSASIETSNICPPDASAKMRQLCLLASLEQFLAENPSRTNGGADILDTQLYDRGTKRQDVDHVFLRFGRRLGL